MDDTSAPIGSRPPGELAAVDAAFAVLLGALAVFTDEQARGASLLPDWTRGHVLTHLARSGDGDRRCVEGAMRDEVVAKYPDAMDGRARDIEAGASRPAAALVEDLAQSQDALVRAWAALPENAWARLGDTPAGRRTMAGIVHSRRRELLVHLVDLDVGAAPRDLPDDYLADDAEWLAEFRPDWTGPG